MQPMPPVRRIVEVAPVTISTSPAGATLVDFGQNLVGMIRLSLPASADTTITLRHAEVLEDGELGTRPLRDAKATDIVHLSGAGGVWEPAFTCHGFRFVVGMFVPCVDAVLPAMPFAGWGDAAVIVPWVLYERYGDTDVLAAQYDSMKLWVDTIADRSQADGLWHSWQFGDWLDPTASPDNPAKGRTDSDLVAAAYQVHALRIVSRWAPPRSGSVGTACCPMARSIPAR